ncbi:peptide ABC transporter substrate-binding protein [Microbacterium faecale]|uniref:Peptide ABC transporter substrate-binding protein n=1 Tax=Microbacterium faecale TaxID=1804630 RepID=A0A916Y2M1_9MICO|nr:ABC transporter substrate-binding protein [Microbacterium faecale]GGD28521.1 peptide ABC transporter substrate-binding protein [Microbacterium faecale]
MRRERNKVLRGFALVVTLSAALAASGCGAGGSEGQTAEATDITFQFAGPPLSGLNPAATGGTTSAYAYATPAYSTLLSQRVTGEIVGDLATEWGYPEGDNLRFDITLRDDATFADGGEVDAAAVQKSLEYVRDGNFYLSSRFAAFENIEVTGDYALTIELSEPVANLPFVLTASGGAGFIISPDAIDDPDSLENATSGSGPYVYSPEKSVIDTTYVYERNPDYYNPDAIKADTLTVQVMNESSTILAALQTGQIDVAQGSSMTADAAASAGFGVEQVGGSVHGIGLLDRSGEIVPALGDVRVRQAINMALDREAITESMLPGGYGVPTEQILAEGQPGYDPDLVGRYAHDVDAAKDLLAEAGYADGFEMTLICAETVGNCTSAEAVMGDLTNVGISVNLETVAVSTSAFDEKVASREYPAAMQRMRTVASEFAPLLLEDVGGSANPFQSEDDQIAQLWREATDAIDPDAQAEAYRALSERVVEEAWFAPLYVQSTVYYVNPEIEGFLVTDENSLYSPIDVEGEYTWSK